MVFCFTFFPTEVTWGNTKITREIFSKGGQGKNSETECFFHFLWLFHNDSSISSNESIVNSVE